MSLPKNCLYENKILSSYARNYNTNIQPQNGTGPYLPGTTIIVNIPTGRNLVMSGADSVLKFTLNVTNGGAINNFIRLDKSCHSLIQRVRVFHGSQLLSDIDNYGNLVSMMMSIQQTTDSFCGKMNILAGTESLSYCDLSSNEVYGLITGDKLNTGAVAANAVLPGRTFCIPIMNFLSYTEKYVPLFAMTGAPLRVELQLVSDPLKAICAKVAVASFSLTNVEYIGNIMEISDTGMEIINLSLNNQPLKWVVQDYRNYSHTANISPSVEVSVPIPAKYTSLRSLLTSFRTKSAGEVTFFPNSSNHLGLSSYSVRLGSKVVPSKQPETHQEFFSELIRSMGSISDLNHEPSVNMLSYSIIQAPEADEETATAIDITSQPQAFYIGLDLESYSNSGFENVYNGYNSSTDDIFLNLRYSSGATTANTRIDTYAYFDQVIMIQDGYCSVQY